MKIFHLTISILGLILFGCDLPRCDESSEAVAMARGLSEDRLAKLYRDMKLHREEILKGGDEGLELVGYLLDHGNIPEEFTDLNPKKVRPAARYPNIMLEGCMDEFVFLRFYGIGEDETYGDHSPRITLDFARDEGSEEILWTQQSGDTANK